MKFLFPSFRKDADIADLAKYVRKALSAGIDIKRNKGVMARIEQCDQYFEAKSKWPDALFIKLNQDFSGPDTPDDTLPPELQHPSMSHEVGDAPSPEQSMGSCGKGIQLDLDSIRLRISTFVAVVTDAIREVDKPWVISASPKPEFPDDINKKVEQALTDVLTNNMMVIAQGDKEAYYYQVLALLRDQEGALQLLREERDKVYTLLMEEYDQKAAESAAIIDAAIHDLIKESNFDQKLDLFFNNFARYDFAVIKTPQFQTGYKYAFKNGKLKEVAKKLLFHEAIHPANYFCSEDSMFDACGTFEMDVGTVTLSELQDMTKNGGDGFNKAHIKDVREYFKDKGRQWLLTDYSPDIIAEGWEGYESIPVIKYHGKIDSDLINPLLDAKQVKQLNALFGEWYSYECVLWVIDEYVIYSAISLSRVVNRPYRVSSYSKHGNHKFDGKGLWTLCYPFQYLMDSYHEMMLKNAGLAAIGMMTYAPNKIALKSFQPWMLRPGARIPVTKTFQDGGNDRVVAQINFDSHLSELLTVVQHFDNEMDRVSEIPSSSIGFGDKLSSIRSTGIASLNQAAVNKAVLRKVYQVEFDVIEPTIKAVLLYSLITTKDPRVMQGAIDVVVDGYSGVMRKQTKAQNLDLVMQNAIGIVNAITSLQANGVDVAGLWYLFKVYLEQSGIDATKIIPNNTGGAMPPPNLPANIGMQQPPLDGRSTATMVNDEAL